MYVPAHFDEPRTEVLHARIAQHPFGTLVTHGKGGLDANHLPFELAAAEGPLGVLRAHVARANPVWQDVANGDEVLVMFHAATPTSRPTGTRASRCITSRCRRGTTGSSTRTDA